MINKEDWIVLIIIVLITFWAICINGVECKAKAKVQGLECEWGPLQGGMVKIGDHWVDYEKARFLE